MPTLPPRPSASLLSHLWSPRPLQPALMEWLWKKPSRVRGSKVRHLDVTATLLTGSASRWAGIAARPSVAALLLASALTVHQGPLAPEASPLQASVRSVAIVTQDAPVPVRPRLRTITRITSVEGLGSPDLDTWLASAGIDLFAALEEAAR